MSEITHIKELRPDKRNARRHNPRNIGMIEKALGEVGAARSIVIDEDGNVLAGNGTIEAAAAAGIEKVQVVDADGETIIAVRRSGLTPEQKQRLALYDNRTAELAEWDTTVLSDILDEQEAALDGLFADDELDALLADVEAGNGGNDADDPGAQVDKAAELQAKWQTALGQVWECGEHRLACGDCRDRALVDRLMSGERADCVFTSPPYAVGVDYGDTYQDTIDNLRALLPDLAALWLDVVTDGGYAVINFGDIAPARNITKSETPCEYPMALEYWPVFRGAGWALWSRRIWCKPNPRVHSPWCIQSNRAATDWEHLWTWKKPGDAIIQRVDGEMRSPLGWIDTSLMGFVDVGKETHGAGMVLGIAQWMINIHCRTGHIVHEPFCGTGTTLIACESMARRCVATDISPAYVAVALQRWADMTGKTPELIEG